MSFHLSFRSFQNQCSDGEKETSVRQIYLCDQMGDKHTNMFYHAFPCYVNNCTVQKRNGVSLLLFEVNILNVSSCPPRKIGDDRTIQGGKKGGGLGQNSQLITGLELFIRCLRLASKQKNH